MKDQVAKLLLDMIEGAVTIEDCHAFLKEAAPSINGLPVKVIALCIQRQKFGDYACWFQQGFKPEIAEKLADIAATAFLRK